VTRESLRRSLTESRMRESASWRMTRGNEEHWTRHTPIEARKEKPGYRAMVESKFDELLSLLYKTGSRAIFFTICALPSGGHCPAS
jgi:hypothetical protein